MLGRRRVVLDQKSCRVSTYKSDSEGRSPNDEVEDLRRAMETRTQIGVALGIVMARLEVDSEAAITFLRRRSQNENRKLHDLAVEIEASRSIHGPERDDPPPLA